MRYQHLRTLKKDETYLGEKLVVALLPPAVLLFQSRDVCTTSIQFGLYSACPLTERIELLEHTLQLGIEFT